MCGNVKLTLFRNGKRLDVPVGGKITQEIRLVPTVGFELTTYRLQGGCSTPELCGHIFNQRKRQCAKVVLLRGIEPPTY